MYCRNIKIYFLGGLKLHMSTSYFMTYILMKISLKEKIKNMVYHDTIYFLAVVKNIITENNLGRQRFI